ncbi:LysR family transcriptional regulator [Xylophilus sp. Kf1]|nr:LysR family transcriptional regulator [Xylophilus sp. Kf1]
MELKQLRYFVAVAETGHMTRAAARLGMQQPPLSQQIRALETRLGIDLFVRHPKGVALTDAGVALLADSRRLLSDADAVERRLRDMAAGRAGSLSIGFTSSAAAHALTPRVLRECRRAWPGIALRIGEDHAAGLTAGIASGRFHCGFLRVPVARPAELVFETLLREPVLLALPTGHAALARQGPVDLRRLVQERFILVRQQGAPGLYAQLLSLCEQIGCQPAATQEVDRMMTALNLVAAGEGVTVVPASMRGAHPDAIEFRPLADPGLDAPLTLVWRAGDDSPALRAFVTLVRQEAGAS